MLTAETTGTEPVTLESLLVNVIAGAPTETPVTIVNKYENKLSESEK
jgi:hypothetical protein